MSFKTNCTICGKSALENIIELPKLPVTGQYRNKNDNISIDAFDQSLSRCANCGHVRIDEIISPNNLYSDQYVFRTSESHTARKAADFFLDFLNRTVDLSKVNNIVEFGCNDGYTLKKMKAPGRTLLGIDLIWKGRESEFLDNDILILGNPIEDVFFSDYLDSTGPDLVYACHTLEHIPEPYHLLESLLKKTEHHTLFALEFPCFNILHENLRFDQIFHQHINYFTFSSIHTMLNRLGVELIDFTINFNHWGSVIVIFKKSKSSNRNEKRLGSKLGKREILERYTLFKKYMNMTAGIIEELRGSLVYGFGAALMLPVLGYHLNVDFDVLKGVIDDDPNKVGLAYKNLPVEILPVKGVDFSKATILLTALDNRRAIISRLYGLLPRRIIAPLPIL